MSNWGAAWEALLEHYPKPQPKDSVTPMQYAERFGVPVGSASNTLRRMWLAGDLDRIEVFAGAGRRTYAYIAKSKPKKGGA